MAEDTQHNGGGSAGGGTAGGAEPTSGPAGADTQAGGSPEQTAAPEPASRRAPGGGGHAAVEAAERRRLRIRRIANWMIALSALTLIGIVLYFVATWLYASQEQSALRDELAAENPGLAAAEQSVSESDFISVDTLLQEMADLAAIRRAEAERQAQFDALKEAAEEFRAQNVGRIGRALGTIVIPSIGVETVMVEGSAESESERYLKKGPGHWPETPMPGAGGSVVVSGHRTTYGAPFRKLNELEPGDVVEVTMPYAIVRYAVTQVVVVKPDEVELVADQGKEMLSLVACHPLYSARERIIAQCDLDSFVLLEPEQ